METETNKEKLARLKKEIAELTAWKSQKDTRRFQRLTLLGYDYPAEEENTLLAKQDGKCAICGIGPGKRKLALDHCHQTGKVRGFLCNSCNFALGAFKDNTILLKRAIEYLEGKIVWTLKIRKL